jgi:hypothetical protein
LAHGLDLRGELSRHGAHLLLCSQQRLPPKRPCRHTTLRKQHTAILPLHGHRRRVNVHILTALELLQNAPAGHASRNLDAVADSSAIVEQFTNAEAFFGPRFVQSRSCCARLAHRCQALPKDANLQGKNDRKVVADLQMPCRSNVRCGLTNRRPVTLCRNSIT